MAGLKMPDINNVLLAGVLTSDPTFRKTSNGTPVANFYIVSIRKFKDNTGQWRDNVCYVGVVAWDRLASSCYENLKRGSAILIDGELQSRSWKNEDGTSRNVVELKARRIQFLNRRSQFESDDEREDKEQKPFPETREEGLFVEDLPESKELPLEPKETEMQRIEKTDFDFGYQNLIL